jgi:hypothetical protein
MKTSGKLTTFPRSVGQIPIYYSHKNTGRPLGNTEGKFENSNLIISMKEMNLYFLWFWIKLHHIRLFKSEVVIRQDEF